MKQTNISEYQSVDSLISIYQQLLNVRSCHTLDQVKQAIGQTKTNLNQSVNIINNSRTRAGVRLKALTNNLTKQLSHIESMYASIDDPFSIFVVGKGKFGKSTLINALLEENKAEIDIVPKTWKIDIFVKGSSNGDVLIRYKDLSTRLMTAETTRLLLIDEEKKRQESERLVNLHFRNGVDKHRHNPQALQEFKLYLKAQYLYVSPIIEVIWPCENSQLLDDFNIVDTPGLQQSLLADDINSSLHDYYNKADGVLWLLDATILDEKSSFDMVNELGFTVENKNIIGIVNRIDEIWPQGIQEVDRVIEKAYANFGDRFAVILPLSAYEAVEGIVNHDDERIRKSGYLALLEQIRRLFMQSGMEIKSKSKIKGLLEYCNYIKQEVNDFSQTLHETMSEKDRIHANCQSQMRLLIIDIENDVTSRLEQYRKSISHNIEIYAEQIFDYTGVDQKDAMNEFIRLRIFDEKQLNKILSSITVDMGRKFGSFYAYWSKNACLREYKYIDLTTLQKTKSLVKSSHDFTMDVQSLNLENTEIGSAAAVMGLGLLVLGPIGLLAGPILHIMGITTWFAKMVKLPKVIEDLKTKLEQLIKANNKKLENEIRKHEKNVMSSISDIQNNSFAELYCPISEISILTREVDFLKQTGQIVIHEVGLGMILKEV